MQRTKPTAGGALIDFFEIRAMWRGAPRTVFALRQNLNRFLARPFGDADMILRLVLSNACTDNTLQKHAEGCCPHSCPSVQDDGDLARIVAAWPRITPEQSDLWPTSPCQPGDDFSPGSQR